MLLYKNTLKKIRQSLGRYLSLLSIIAIGVATYGGVRETIPNIARIQSAYYRDTNLMDFKVTGTLGLTDDDVAALRQLEEVSYVEGSYSLSALDGDKAVKVHAITHTDRMRLIEGRLPEKETEALGEEGTYQIGDVITLSEPVDDEDKHLKNTTFTITGTITSPLYTSTDYGTIDVGNGILAAYLFIPSENFDYDVYTEVYIALTKNADDMAYSDTYKQRAEGLKQKINALKPSREKTRYDEVITEAQEKLDDAKSTLKKEKDKAKKKINDAQKEIDDNLKKINDGKKELAKQKKKAQKEFAKAQKQLDQAQKELNAGKKKAKAEFKKAEAQMAASKKQLDEASKAFQKEKAAAEKQLAPAREAKASLEAGIKQLDASLNDIAAKLSGDLDEETRQQLEGQQAALTAQKQQMSSQLADVTAEITKATKALNEAKAQIDQGYAQLRKARKEINAQKKALTTAQAKISAGYKQLARNKRTYTKKIKDNEQKLNKALKKLKKGQKTLNKKKKEFAEKINDAQIKLDDAQAEIDDIEDAKWYVLTRDDVVTGYQLLEIQFDEVTAIADLFPFFFILIVVMMTSNTMARMIVEERSEMGTMTSLGFSSAQIIWTYLLYVLSSTLIGTIGGYLLGTLLIPQIIYNVFPVKMPEMHYYGNTFMLVIMTCVAVTVMSLVTIYNCMKELKDQPAALQRPKAPKAGQKILMEQITVIWQRLSFSWKVTMRNLARYKNRAIITILGTMGCSFIIMLGFGLRDGINGVGAKQYTEFFTYENITVLKQSISSPTASYRKLTSGYIDEPLLLYQNTYKAIQDDETISFYMIVPESAGKPFTSYFNLQNKKTKEKLTLTDEGAIISMKIASKFHYDVGDPITFEDGDKKTYQTTIIGITENYVANYMYLTPQSYQTLFHDDLSYNIIVGKNATTQDQITRHVLDSEKAVSIQYTRDLIEKANGGITGLNQIVVLLVVIASLLAFSVLYNLTSINISERTREIATLKVLGFDDRETNNYVYRETIINILIGIVCGLIVSTIVWPIFIDFIENDNNVFLREIKPLSYLYTTLISLSFLFVMQIVTFLKIYAINMIESLKSIE